MTSIAAAGKRTTGSESPRGAENGLVVEGLVHAFDGRRIVDTVGFSVAPGEVLCLLGPSGVGKSTILRLIAGLERVQQGRISIGGETVADETLSMPPERRGVGLVFQDFALFPHLTVLQNVAFGLASLPAAERRRRAMEELEKVGMAAFAEAWPHTLSGGEQQRVALARASAPRPRVMLLDEPFSNLDLRMRRSLREMLRTVLKASDAATVIVTHDPDEAAYMADRIVVVKGGKLIQAGTPDEIYAAPADAYVAGLFGEVNQLVGTVVDGHVETPVGRVCAPGVAEGSSVDVLIRQEGLRLGQGVGTGEGTVLASRLMGRGRLVRVRCACEDEGSVTVDARVPSAFSAGENQTVGLGLDPSQAFVFPREAD